MNETAIKLYLEQLEHDLDQLRAIVHDLQDPGKVPTWATNIPPKPAPGYTSELWAALTEGVLTKQMQQLSGTVNAVHGLYASLEFLVISWRIHSAKKEQE
jgi:hypothetical protein